MRQSSGKLAGLGGLQLFYRLWEPSEVKGNLVLVHGVGEHGGRYEHVAAWFAGQGFAVWAMDHRGHGQSEGIRSHVDRFDDYLQDLKSFVSLAASRYGKPVMLGHSMGGLIAFHYARRYPEILLGLVLSSPWMKTRYQIPPVAKALLPVLSAVAPRVRLAGEIDPTHATRNPEFHEKDRVDPLIIKGFTPRWLSECLHAAAACHTSMSFPSELPVLFAVAGADLLVNPEATRSVFDQLAHERKAFRLYPEKYHEILNDPGYEEVMAEILTWLKAQGLGPA